MFTFVIEAFYPSIHVWMGVDRLRLLDVVQRAMQDIYPPQLDLVKFLVRLLHLVLSTQLSQCGGSFFEIHSGFVHWSSMRKRIGRSLPGCAGLTCVAQFRQRSQVSRPLHWWRFWSPGFKENLSHRGALSSEWLECIHQSVFHRDQESVPVRGFGQWKACAYRGQQKVWCLVLLIPQEAEHLQLRAWRFGPSPVYEAEHNQSRAHSSLTNKLFSRQLWVGRQILLAEVDTERPRWQRFRSNRQVLSLACQENAARKPKASQEELFIYKVQYSRGLRRFPFSKSYQHAYEAYTEIFGSWVQGNCGSHRCFDSL